MKKLSIYIKFELKLGLELGLSLKSYKIFIVLRELN